MSQHRDIQVNIDVSGDVSNSTITGVTINYRGVEQRSASRNLLTRILVDLLQLPSFQDLDARFSVWNAQRSERFIEVERVRDLWNSMPSPRFPNRSAKAQRLPSTAPDDTVAVKLNDVQLTRFVSRQWGQPYLGSYYHDWEVSGDILTPSFSWPHLARMRGKSVSRVGLGDLRFKPTEGGLYLLNMVSSGSARWATGLDQTRRTGPVSSRGSQSLSPYGLGKELHDFTQAIRYNPGDVDQLTLGGYPIIMTRECYMEIIEPVERYGAAAVDSLIGTIIRVPESVPTTHGVGVPKWCLYVGSRAHIKNVKRPEPLVSSAWTVLAGDFPARESVPRYRGRSTQPPQTPNTEFRGTYAQWMFRVGTPDWNQELGNAVDVIQTVREKLGAIALFEFDEEQNWYGPNTLFTPASIREMYRQFQQADTRDLAITLPIDDPKPPLKKDNNA